MLMMGLVASKCETLNSIKNPSCNSIRSKNFLLHIHQKPQSRAELSQSLYARSVKKFITTNSEKRRRVKYERNFAPVLFAFC